MKLWQRCIIFWIFLFFAQGVQAEVKPFLKGSLSSILEESKGIQTAIIFWSVTCSPCIQEMYLWKELVQKDPELNLVFVSTDMISTSDKISKILNRFELEDHASWAFADSFVEKIRFDVDPQWYGELPLTFLLSTNGNMQKVIGMVEDQDLKQWGSPLGT